MRHDQPSSSNFASTIRSHAPSTSREGADPGGARTRTRRRSVFAALAAPLLLLSLTSQARAQAIVQEYYVPMPEAQIRTSFLTLAPASSASIDSVISIVAAVAGTRVVYDHWEDGYESNLNSPTQSTTKIWGDGNNANGIPPGFASDPASFSYGAVLALRNQVPLPRSASTILYDGRDRVGATRGIVMSRSGWATSPGPLLADGTEVQSTIDWGTSFAIPIGENVIIPTPLTSSMFEHTSIMVMASLNATQIQIDKDANGSIDITTTINQGESYQVPSGILRGATVVSNKPVQVQVLAGDIGANYENRWYTIPSLDQWTPTYYSPVGTAANGEATYIFLYNHNASAITINYTTRTGTGSFSIPAKSTYTFLAPQNSGTKFVAAGGEDFFAVGAAGAALTSNNVHDWGFDLVPTENLTTEMIVGWGPGSLDGTQNGNPVWVTPVSATTIYVDYNGDHAGALTDPLGGKYDLAISSAALQVNRVFEPDKDQTGQRLYTVDGTLITGAWGQDPATAGPALPYLDIGTTVPNFPVPLLTKSSTVFTDTAPIGQLNIGDTLEYTITLNNQGLVAIGNALVLDTLPASLSYVAGTTTRDGVAVPDAGSTPFPLDESGVVVPIIPRRSSTSFKFRATISATGSIINSANSSTGQVSTTVSVVPPPVTNACVIDFTNNSGTTVTSRVPGDGIYVTVTDNDANTNTGSAQTIQVTVNASGTGDLETITLTETGNNTGIFRNTAALPSSATAGGTPNDGTLRMVAGSTLSVVYTDPLYSDTCNDSVGVTVNSAVKYLYLDTDGSDGDTAGDLDRVDPVATADGTISATSTLAAPSLPAITTGTTTSNQVSNATSLTFAHTPGAGSNQLLLVAVGVGGNSASANGPTVSGVTYGGTAMTQVGTIQSTAVRSYIFAMLSPAAGPLNVVVSTSGSASIAASATTFSNVDVTSLATALGSYQSASAATGNPAQTATSAAGELVFSTVALDEGTSAQSLTVNGTQSTLYLASNHDWVSTATSTKAGAASVALNYTSGDTAQEYGMSAVSIKPGGTPTAGGSVTFTQTPTLCENLVIPAGATLTAETYFSVVSGSMPASPSVTAEIKYGVTTLATSTSASSNGSRIAFTFPALGSTTTIPSGSALQLVVTNNQTGVSFQVQYDASTRPSFIGIPTTTVIHVDSVGVYDAAYPGGSLTTTGTNGSTLYVRTVVGDPFGSADITSLPLTIDGTGTSGDVSTTLTDANLATSTSCSKTYQYTWVTGSQNGSYTITAQAREGFENTVTDSKSTIVDLNPADLGTPCQNEFTSGSNGAGTLTYSGGTQVCIRITDLDQNTLPASAESLSVTVSATSGDSETFSINETGVNTGVFAGCVPASTGTVGTSNNGTIYAPLGTSLSASYTDPTDTTDVCTDAAAVPSAANSVAVTKTLITPTDGQAKLGEAIQWRIRVTNTGPGSLATVAVSDSFPAANLTYVSASPTPNTVGSGSLSWTNVGPLASGASTDILVNFTALAVPVANPVVNSTSVSATGGLTANASSNVNITNPALTIVKTHVSPASPVAKGTNVNYTISVTNSGNTIIDTLPLEDSFSPGCFDFVSSVPAADSSGAGSANWNDLTGAGSLAVGASTNVTVVLQAKGACNPATNTAAVNFGVDQFSDSVPPASGSADVVTLAAEISGFVYEDQGAAGFGGDVGLTGVSVALYTDPNGDGDPSDGTLVEVQSTLAGGAYSFTNLGLGNYVVVETDPFGYESIDDTQGSDTDNRVAVVVASYTSYPNNNFLDDVIPPANYGSIAGQVRNDVDGDGDFTDGDSGLAGAIVDLYTDPNGDGDFTDGFLFLSVTTTASGNYSFPGLPPGSYVVVETNPSGYTSTGDVAGLNDDRIAVTVPAATAVTGRNFLDTSLVLGSLGDRVWLDEDGDGVQDAGEDGIPGVTVSLYDSTGTVLQATTTTDTDGRYVFHGVTTGNHVVRVDSSSLAAGLAANPTYDLDGTGSAHQTVVTSVAATFVATADFGYNWVSTATTTAPALGATGAIGDRIWNDADGDGVQDFGESGIAGVTVRLLTDDNGDGSYGGVGDAAATTAVTDSYGNYIFDGIAPRAYVVQVDTSTLPAGFTTVPTSDPDSDGDSTTRPVVLAPGDVWLNGDFGYTAPVGYTIGDTIFLDANADGDLDAGEPGLVGVTVTLSDTLGNVIASTKTDASGNYFFPKLQNGSYVVTVTDTAGILLDTPVNTAAPATGYNRSSTVTISGANDLAQDFGFAPLGHDAGEGLIGDTIFLDRDGDNAFDAGEGLDGITVQLWDAANTTQLATTTTDASGRYSFGGLGATTTYTVRVLTTSLPNGGTGLTNSVDPDGGVASRSTVNLSLFTNGISLTQDFGYAASTPNTISGTVFNDTNANGTLAAGETGRYAGVIVTLRDSLGRVVATTTTNASGNYSFTGLPNGTYTVDVSEDGNVLGGLWKSNGTAPGADNNSQVDPYTVTVTGGATNTTADFGYYGAGGSLGNFVWQDSDNDGIQDGGEPGLTGRPVTLTITYPSGDVTTVVATTNASGFYAFYNLLLDENFDGAGGGEPSYSISTTTPAGAAVSPIGAGGNALLDSNDPSGTTATAAKGVTDATNASFATNGYDFGFAPVADLEIVKTGPASVTPGTNVSYTLVITNNGPGSAVTTVATDPTPAGATFVSNSGDCVTPFPCALGSLGSGATRTITTTFAIDAGYTTPDPFVNTASVSSSSPDSNLLNNSSSASSAVIPLIPQSDLEIVKTGPATVTPGEDVVYTIVVTNNGPQAATGVSVSDPTPAGLSFQSNSGNCSTAYPCSLGGMAVGATRTITTTYTVGSGYTAPDPLVNTATVSATSNDTNAANNSSSASSTLAHEADLSITKDDGVATYTPGGSITYAIVVSNAGPSDVTGATVSDTLPPQLQDASWTCSGSGGASCTAAGSGDISDSSVNIPSGASVTYTLNAQVVQNASVNPLVNTATVTPPGGVTDPTPANNSDDDSDTPAAAPGRIGDRVWLDENGDGVQDAGEDGIAGVTVNLYDAAGVILLASTTTDLDGRYVFGGLAAGPYVVRVDAASMPAGLSSNVTWDLDDGTTAPDGETLVAAVAGELTDTADFGYNWVPASDSTTPAPGATGAIGDRIWNDADGDGVQDDGEAGIEGVTVRLLTDDNGDGIYGGAGDNAATTATTNESGHYIFDGIAPGAYVVEVDTATLPAGFTTSPTGDPDSDGDNRSNPVIVAPGDVWVNGDFGYEFPTGHTIGDRVWLDADGDGIQDGGEPGIAGVSVVLLDAGGFVVASTTTDASGLYAFPGLPNGVYTVIVTDTAGVLAHSPRNSGDPDGGFDASSSVVLSGADNLVQDFGFTAANHENGDGAIGDTIFLDRDGDASFDAGEGIEGVTVRLFASDGTTAIATAVTDAGGRYFFGGLDATETYVVIVDTSTLPMGGAQLFNNVDPDGGVASRATVNLTGFAGGVTLTQDFGYIPNVAPNTIGGTLWNDVDGDGLLDGSESGRYEDVVVVLRDSNGNIVATTTTDASGSYQFDGLPDDTYTVDVAENGNVLGGLWKSTGPSASADGNSQDDPYSVTVAGGATDTTGDFGFFGLGGSLGNRVFADADNDGIQDVGETGIAGVTVTLTITWPTGDVTTVVTTSSSTGAYAFVNLLLDESFDGAGGGEPTYEVGASAPATYQASPVGAGGDPLADSDDPSGSPATAARGINDTVTDTLAQNGYDFGYASFTDLEVVKNGPASVAPGSSITYTVTVTNVGTSPAVSTVVTDPTPSGLTFTSNTGNCVSAYPCSLGTLNPGETRTINSTYSVPAGYTTPNPIVNTATVSTASPDSNAANNSDPASTTVAPSADLSIDKLGPGAVTPGNNVVYTIIVTNNGPSNATGVSVADPTPSGLTFVMNSGACTTPFPCAIGNLASGASVTITSTFSVPLSYTTPTPIVNTATVSATTPDPTPANNTDSASTNLNPLNADLEISKTGPASVTRGSTVSYTLVITNNGPTTANATSVADPTPAGLTFVSNSGDCTTAFPCSLGNLANGASRTITSTYSVPANYAGANPVVNTAVVSSSTSDSTPGNNTDTASTPVVSSADLKITKTGPARVLTGTNVVYTITVWNDGPSDAATVTLADPTPSGLTFVSNVGGCAGGFPCSLGTLAAGASATITTTFAVPSTYTSPNPIVNTATVSSPTPDPAPGDNSSSASTEPVGRITGVVWNDVDQDGTTDNNESGIAGVLVKITGPSCPAGCTTTTLANGNYSFTNLTLGAYTVVESDPNGFTSTTPNAVNVTVGPSPATANFGDRFGGGESDLSMIKGHSGIFTACGTGVYTLQVRNGGPFPSDGVVTVVDTLPAGVTYVSASGAGWSCSANGQTVTCTSSVSIAEDASSGVITLLVSLAESTFPTVANTATVSNENDSNPVNNSATHGVTVRAGDCGEEPGETCKVSLRKLHAGNNNPGGEIHYTLQWSNACRSDIEDAVITDPMPAGLLLLSATSSDAVASISGNTAVFTMASFGAGEVGKGFITAKIDEDAEIGSLVRNVATYTDGSNNLANGTNTFRVRGSTDDGGSSVDDTPISCFVRAQIYARPGRYVKYETRYKNGSESNSLTLTLPDEVEIDWVFPPASSRVGQTLHWNDLARTAGKVTVNTFVNLTAEDEAILPTSAVVSDGLGETAVCEHTSTVDRYEKLFTSIKAQSHARAGLGLRYTARYREAVGHNEMTITLPDEVTVVRAIPAPTGGTDHTLTWSDLPLPSGVVKVDVVVNAGVADGTVLVGSVVMTDDSTDVVGAETQTTIGSTSSTGGATDALAISLSTLRSVTAGTTTDVTVRYENMQAPGRVTITLPNELTPSLAIPGAVFNGQQVSWEGIASASGTLKVRVDVASNANPGKTLAISATANDGAGVAVSDTASSTVRGDDVEATPLAMSLTLANTVTKGITSDITAEYDGLQGSGELRLTLPPQMTLQSSVPSGAQVQGNQVVFSNLDAATGSLRARVLVSSSAVSGSVLSVSGSVSDTSGATGSAAGTTTVR